MSGMDRLTDAEVFHYSHAGKPSERIMARELLAHRRASQAAPAPSDGLREAWIAGRDAAAAEAFYACGCKDSIEALTPPAAYSRAAPTEGEA